MLEEKFNSREADMALEDFISRMTEKYPDIKQSYNNIEETRVAVRRATFMYLQGYSSPNKRKSFCETRYAEFFAKCQFYRDLLLKARNEHSELQQNKGNEDEIQKAQFICEIISAKGKEAYGSLLFSKKEIERYEAAIKRNDKLGNC